MPKKIFLDFHNGILKHYGLPLPRADQKKKRMMFYAHCSTPRRCWLDVENTMKVMGEVFDVFTVHDFGVSGLVIFSVNPFYHEFSSEIDTRKASRGIQ